MSVLADVKADLGLTADNNDFDETLLSDINLALASLHQLYPRYTLKYVDYGSEWITERPELLSLFKRYVSLKTFTLFEATSASSVTMSNIERNLKEIEFRIIASK